MMGITEKLTFEQRLEKAMQVTEGSVTQEERTDNTKVLNWCDP